MIIILNIKRISQYLGGLRSGAWPRVTLLEWLTVKIDSVIQAILMKYQERQDLLVNLQKERRWSGRQYTEAGIILCAGVCERGNPLLTGNQPPQRREKNPKGIKTMILLDLTHFRES